MTFPIRHAHCSIRHNVAAAAAARGQRRRRRRARRSQACGRVARGRASPWWVKGPGHGALRIGLVLSGESWRFPASCRAWLLLAWCGHEIPRSGMPDCPPRFLDFFWREGGGVCGCGCPGTLSSIQACHANVHGLAHAVCVFLIKKGAWVHSWVGDREWGMFPCSRRPQELPCRVPEPGGRPRAPLLTLSPRKAHPPPRTPHPLAPVQVRRSRRRRTS